MHPAVSLCLAFLAHACMHLFIIHQQYKYHLRVCVRYSIIYLGWFNGPRRIIPRARFVLLFIAICAAEDVLLPRDLLGWFAIKVCAIIMIVMPPLDLFLTNSPAYFANCAIIGLVTRAIFLHDSQSCANFAMCYAARAMYAILLSCIDRYLARFNKSKIRLQNYAHAIHDVDDPNGTIMSAARAMW